MNPEHNVFTGSDVVLKLNGEVIGTAQSTEAEVVQVQQKVGELLQTASGSFVGGSIEFGQSLASIFRDELPKVDIVEEKHRGIRQYRSKKKRLQKKWRKRNHIDKTVYKNCTITGYKENEVTFQM